MKSLARKLLMISLIVAVGSIMGCAGGSAHEMLGKEAPDFTVTLLDGGTFVLGDHLGKDAIILDFWASWCPPCREALPVVSATAKKYADQGLVFCAVNVGEEQAEAEDHIKKAGLHIPVGLDTDGAVSEAYGVKGIPQTVIIGKDGKIAVVHVGYSSAMGGQLNDELESLLARSTS